MPAGASVQPSSQPWQVCSERISMTRPCRSRCSSTWRVCACQALPVAPKTAPSRLEAVVGAHRRRKSRRWEVSFMTCSRRSPSTRVTCRVAPGLSTGTA